MKKYALFVMTCILYASVLAQKPYVIYDLSGKVDIKEYKGQKWNPAEKKQTVSGVDSVFIAPKGELRIMDNRTNLIYKSTSTGKMRILTIINDAKKQTSNTLAAINRDLLEGAKRQSTSPTMQVVGATTRALGENPELEDSIAATFVAVAQKALRNELLENKEVQLIENIRGDELTFTIKNNSEEGYFVNVLRINRTAQTVSLCYVISEAMLESEYLPCVYLPQKQSADFSSIPLGEYSNDLFVLVATENPYHTEYVASVLKYANLSELSFPLYEKCVVGMVNNEKKH